MFFFNIGVVDRKVHKYYNKQGRPSFLLRGLKMRAFKEKAKKHLEEVEDILQGFETTPEVLQYYIPMGYKMSCHIMGTLPALTYLCELRSTTYVHPTLRLVAIAMGELIEQETGIPLFLDKNPELLDLRRGKQDIKLKEEE